MSPNVQPKTPQTEKPLVTKPFVIELWEEGKQPGGYFTPAAAMLLTSSLRTSGLLRELSPDDLKSLIYLLTFVSPEGHCQPFLSQLAEAMHSSSAKTKARMRRLCDLKWKGEPIVIYSKSASGLSAYSLNPRIVQYRHREADQRRQSAPYAAAPRDAVIAHSRNRYARPRAEVERIIAAQMGHEIEETEDQRKLRYRLENVGLTGEQATEVVLTYSPDVIAQQLDWLPYRNAKNPAGYLLAAIEGGYSEPRAVREERIFRELRYGELQAESIPAEDREVAPQPEAEQSDNGLEATPAEQAVKISSDASPGDVREPVATEVIDLPLPGENENAQ